LANDLPLFTLNPADFAQMGGGLLEVVSPTVTGRR
jgi:hypothetical protein